MKYEQLSAEYKYDTLAGAMYAREMEFFHYDFDCKNFEYLLENVTDADFVADIAERLNATRKQMAATQSIMAALRAQIDDEAAYSAAVERAMMKRRAEGE